MTAAHVCFTVIIYMLCVCPAWLQSFIIIASINLPANNYMHTIHKLAVPSLLLMSGQINAHVVHFYKLHSLCVARLINSVMIGFSCNYIYIH